MDSQELRKELFYAIDNDRMYEEVAEHRERPLRHKWSERDRIVCTMPYGHMQAQVCERCGCRREFWWDKKGTPPIVWDIRDGNSKMHSTDGAMKCRDFNIKTIE